MGRNTSRRLKRLETAQRGADGVPTDLIGREYSRLPVTDRTRFMRYIYGDDIDLERAETIEMHVRGTLHFICEELPFDSPFWRRFDREMEDGLLALDRKLSI